MVFLVYWGARRLRVNLDRLTWPHKLTCFSAETWDKTQGGLDIVTYSPVEARSPPNRKQFSRQFSGHSCQLTGWEYPADLVSVSQLQVPQPHLVRDLHSTTWYWKGLGKPSSRPGKATPLLCLSFLQTRSAPVSGEIGGRRQKKKKRWLVRAARIRPAASSGPRHVSRRSIWSMHS